MNWGEGGDGEVDAMLLEGKDSNGSNLKKVVWGLRFWKGTKGGGEERWEKKSLIELF